MHNVSTTSLITYFQGSLLFLKKNSNGGLSFHSFDFWQKRRLFSWYENANDTMVLFSSRNEKLHNVKTGAIAHVSETSVTVTYFVVYCDVVLKINNNKSAWNFPSLSWRRPLTSFSRIYFSSLKVSFTRRRTLKTLNS